jgi:hypothetical protein
MSEINHFKILYYTNLCGKWRSADLAISGWYDSW